MKYIYHCENCGSKKWNSISSFGGETATFTCRICEHKGPVTGTPTEVIPAIIKIDGEFKDSSKELEIFDDLGWNVAIVYHDYSRKDDEMRYNITEIHWRHDTYGDEPSVALESDVHSHGGTIDIYHIKQLTAVKSEKKHTFIYDK